MFNGLILLYKYPKAIYEGNLLGDALDNSTFKNFKNIKKQKSKKKRLDILYLSSCGGHLVQILEIAKNLKSYNYHFIVNDRTDLNEIMIGRTTYIVHAERNVMQVLNF